MLAAIAVCMSPPEIKPMEVETGDGEAMGAVVSRTETNKRCLQSVFSCGKRLCRRPLVCCGLAEEGGERESKRKVVKNCCADAKECSIVPESVAACGFIAKSCMCWGNCFHYRCRPDYCAMRITCNTAVLGAIACGVTYLMHWLNTDTAAIKRCEGWYAHCIKVNTACPEQFAPDESWLIENEKCSKLADISGTKCDTVADCAPAVDAAVGCSGAHYVLQNGSSLHANECFTIEIPDDKICRNCIEWDEVDHLLAPSTAAVAEQKPNVGSEKSFLGRLSERFIGL